MQVMAGEAGERALALEKTTALSQIDRLMTHVPRLVPIAQRPVLRRPVTSPAEFVDPGRRHPPRILNKPFGLLGLARGRGFHVRATGSVTGLASHAELRGLNR